MGISSGVGDVIAPVSYGFRNVIINGNFSINQRAYASGASLSSGTYGFDRWKSNAAGTTLTFTSAPQGQLVTINIGGYIRQIVERANVPAGSYVLSWSGTVRGRIYNEGATPPDYKNGPLFVYLDGTANVIVEFGPHAAGTETLGEVQLERGQRQTPFEFRPIGVELQLCQRYYEKSYVLATAPGTATSTGAWQGSQSVAAPTTSFLGNACIFQTWKRAAPTVTVYDHAGNINKCHRFTLGLAGSDNSNATVDRTHERGFYIYSNTGNSGSGISYQFVASIEL